MAFEANIGSSGRKFLENIDPEKQEAIDIKTGLSQMDYAPILDQLKEQYEMSGDNLVSEIN